MPQKNKRKVAHLNRLLNYILGNRPDEFGLVPDKEGYISLKELLKAINEEPNMAYVRETHIQEVLYIIEMALLRLPRKRYDLSSEILPQSIGIKIAFILQKRSIRELNERHTPLFLNLGCCRDQESI